MQSVCLTVNAYKLDTNDDFEKMSPKEQKNIFVDKRGTRLKPQKRQIIDILIVIATTYLLHRKIETAHERNKSADEVGKDEEVRSL